MTWSIPLPSRPALAVASEAKAGTVRPSPPVLLVMVYAAAMPFLAGIPRGTVLPVLRPSEMLQLAMIAGAGILGLGALATGRRWHVRLRPVEWWLLAMTTAASAAPLLWLLARGLPVGQDELLAAFPFVKYAMLYLVVRACVTSAAHLEALSRAVVLSALAVASIAVAQAFNVGPVLDVLGRFYVAGVEDLVDEGRGTTTLGSSIATGAYLSIAAGLALSWGLTSGRRLWLAATGYLVLGALASGQAGSVVAIGIVLFAVAHLHGRTARLIQWSVPIGALAAGALWPVVAARLQDIDQGSGLPSSWIIRWNNISELYLPSLADGGWILGVSPDAILSPPDVWRSAIYLESGYLWLLWVGGVPLLIAAIGFLVSAWRSLGARADGSTDLADDHGQAATAVAVAAQGAVAMMLLLSVIDPHLSLRGGADLFFILLALGLARSPMAQETGLAADGWRRLFGFAAGRGADYPAVRVQLTELAAARQDHDRQRAGADGVRSMSPDTGLQLTARLEGRRVGTVDLWLRHGPGPLRGATGGPTSAGEHPIDAEHAAILWRGLAMIADSLRLDELHLTAETPAEEPAVAGVVHRGELKVAARLAETLEIERSAIRHRVRRSVVVTASDGSEQNPESAIPPPSAPSDAPAGDLPALRLSPALSMPRWKRLLDISLGGVALVASAPLWALCAGLVRTSSPGPALYRQIRVGTGGLPFQIYKFRTMYVDNDDSAHRAQNRREILENAEAAKDDADPRITPIGGLLRRSSLDELPQLINVLQGDMSLVGPRPSLLWETELFRPPTRRRLRLRPGITGLWQVNGRADLSMSEMLDLDLDYVDGMSPGLDLRCLAKTATSVLAREGAR